MNVVTILFDGYSDTNPDDPESMLANCTCTLIQTPTEYIIVDTMTPWDGDAIVEKLKTLDITPHNISTIITTHGHSDHCGNNNLFRKATKLIFGQCVSFKNVYQQFDFQTPLKISEDIEVIATPGHTHTCVSVIVRNSSPNGKTIAVTGDLFEKRTDVDKCEIWKSAGSEDPAMQMRNRLRVAEMADFIVPGHGPMFEVTDAIRAKLKEDC